MPRRISTVRGRAFGAALKAAFALSGLSPRRAATLIGWDDSKISDLSKGKGGSDEADLALLLGVLRTPRALRRHLQWLFPGVDRIDWLQLHGRCSRVGNQTFDENLAAAKTFVSWHTHMIPDGLQTPSYARAVLGASSTAPRVELEERLQAYLKRQDQLLQHPRLRCTFYVHEIALRWPVDSMETQIEQVRHLLQMARRSRISIRILPEACGAHAGLRGPFTYLEFDRYPPFVWLENENSSLILENAQAVAGYTEVIKSLDATSLDADQSKAALKELLPS